MGLLDCWLIAGNISSTPPVPFDIDSEMESLVDKNPNSYGLEEILIYNNDCYSQIEEDFFYDWYWASLPNEVVHCGPECRPFLGKQTYSVGPFTLHMFTILDTSIFVISYIS